MMLCECRTPNDINASFFTGGGRVSFHTDNDLLPLFPADPGLNSVLETELKRRLHSCLPDTVISLDVEEREKIQYFTVRFSGPRQEIHGRHAVIAFDILEQRISFPTEPTRFALVAMSVFGECLFGQAFVPEKKYCLKKMLSWCSAPLRDVFSMSRITFSSFILIHAPTGELIQCRANGNIYERFVEEYGEKHAGVAIMIFGFEVRFKDGAVRHFYVNEKNLAGFRNDLKLFEFEQFLTEKDCVEIVHESS